MNAEVGGVLSGRAVDGHIHAAPPRVVQDLTGGVHGVRIDDRVRARQLRQLPAVRYWLDQPNPSSRAQHQKLIREGHEQARKFSWEATARLVLEIYREVAKPKAR